MSLNAPWIEGPDAPLSESAVNAGKHVVLMVDDHQDPPSELKHVLELSGYNVIDTDNGQDAASWARQRQPDLLLVDLDVPLLYGLVAARQILKHSQLEMLPVVIVSHDEVLDPAPIMEVGARGNEYVTRISDYEQLEHLLDYLLPVLIPPVDAPLASSQSSRRSAPTH
jgi:DNA-binding response OmpR family regulator